VKCPACGTVRPGKKAESEAKDKAAASAAAGPKKEVTLAASLKTQQWIFLETALHIILHKQLWFLQTPHWIYLINQYT
jgi:hypothetical protein